MTDDTVRRLRELGDFMAEEMPLSDCIAADAVDIGHELAALADQLRRPNRTAMACTLCGTDRISPRLDNVRTPGGTLCERCEIGEADDRLRSMAETGYGLAELCRFLSDRLADSYRGDYGDRVTLERDTLAMHCRNRDDLPHYLIVGGYAAGERWQCRQDPRVTRFVVTAVSPDDNETHLDAGESFVGVSAVLEYLRNVA